MKSDPLALPANVTFSGHITSQAQIFRDQSVGLYESEKPKSDHISHPEHQVPRISEDPVSGHLLAR